MCVCVCVCIDIRVQQGLALLWAFASPSSTVSRVLFRPEFVPQMCSHEKSLRHFCYQSHFIHFPNATCVGVIFLWFSSDTLATQRQGPVD